MEERVRRMARVLLRRVAVLIGLTQVKSEFAGQLDNSWQGQH